MKLLGLDIGMTGCKATIFNEQGIQLGHAYQEYQTIRPHNGWTELNVDNFWKIVSNIIRKAVNDRYFPDAIGLSCMGGGCVAIDKKGNILRNPIIGLDTRYEKEWYDSVDHEKIYRITGMPSHSLYATLHKILWIRDQEPEVYKESRTFTNLQGLVFLKMGFDPVIDYSLASSTMLFDIVKKTWSQDILRMVNISRSLLPNVVSSKEIVGTINAKIAAELGLSKREIPVVAGGHDQSCGSLGVGAIEQGIAVNSTGTVEAIISVSHKPVLTPESERAGFTWECHVVPEIYSGMGFNPSAGSVLRWYRDLLNQGEEIKKNYQEILNKITSAPTKVFLLPHFQGSGTPYMDVWSQGAMLGLNLHTCESDIVRSILEGLTYEARIIMEAFKDLHFSINEFRAIGGGANSQFWLQMKADILGKIVRKPRAIESGCMGAAILAGVGTGMINTFKEAIENMVKIDTTFEPCKNRKQEYNNRFRIYKKIYPALKEVNHLISDLR